MIRISLTRLLIGKVNGADVCGDNISAAMLSLGTSGEENDDPPEGLTYAAEVTSLRQRCHRALRLQAS